MFIHQSKEHSTMEYVDRMVGIPSGRAVFFAAEDVAAT